MLSIEMEGWCIVGCWWLYYCTVHFSVRRSSWQSRHRILWFETRIIWLAFMNSFYYFRDSYFSEYILPLVIKSWKASCSRNLIVVRCLVYCITMSRSIGIRCYCNVVWVMVKINLSGQRLACQDGFCR